MADSSLGYERHRFQSKKRLPADTEGPEAELASTATNDSTPTENAWFPTAGGDDRPPDELSPPLRRLWTDLFLRTDFGSSKRLPFHSQHFWAFSAGCFILGVQAGPDLIQDLQPRVW